jgi:hypothetical protein
MGGAVEFGEAPVKRAVALRPDWSADQSLSSVITTEKCANSHGYNKIHY